MIHGDDKDWWIKHSGDYVLGLMSNADRLVFERIMHIEPDVQKLVVQWREKLQPLSAALTPIEPPEHILPSLITSLPVAPEKPPGAKTASSEAVAASVGTATKKLSKEQTQQADKRAGILADGTAFMRMIDDKQKSADGWRSFAGLASVACIGMGMLGWVGYKANADKEVEHRYDAISIVESASAQPLWIVDSSSENKTLRITSLGNVDAEEGKVYELWMQKPDDGGVVSMGLLPTDANASTQFKARKFDGSATGFSVSLEDEGGSPEPVPVGPVMYKGLLNTLSY